MSKINKRVWHASGGNSILFGVVKEQRFENNWLLVRVDWHYPDGRVSDLDEWQKISNLGSVEDLEKHLSSFNEPG